MVSEAAHDDVEAPDSLLGSLTSDERKFVLQQRTIQMLNSSHAGLIKPAVHGVHLSPFPPASYRPSSEILVATILGPLC